MTRFVTPSVLVLSLLLAATSYAAVITVTGFDTPALQAAIARSQPGDEVRLPAGTYSLTEALAPKSSTRLMGTGRDRTILRYAGDQAGVFISLGGVHDVTVADMTLDGRNDPLLGQGIAASDARALELRRLTIRNLVKSGYGPHGILFSGVNPTRERGVTDSLIADCAIENIAPDNGWGAGIRLAWGSSRNQVLNCRIDNTGRGGVLTDNGSTDLVIRGNTVTGSHGEKLGIEVWGGCDRCVIEDNRIDHWLSIGGSDRCAVRRNTISCQDGDFAFIGIEAIGSFLIFTDNAVDDGQVIGLSVSSTLRKQYHYYGGNTFRRCSQWAAQLQGESNGLGDYYLYRCRFSDTTMDRGYMPYPGDAGHGFRMNGNGRHVVLEECEIAGNARCGIQLTTNDVDYLSFVSCTVKSNKGGVTNGFGPRQALEWRDCVVEGNGTDAPPAAAPFLTASPTAAFRVIGEPRVGVTLRFASDSPATKRILWDLGDGIPLTGRQVRHAYSKPGTYTVTQIVWDEHHRAARATQQVSVTP